MKWLLRLCAAIFIAVIVVIVAINGLTLYIAAQLY